MLVSANTKISALIKANPNSIEVISSINKHFEKLRNPVLRKILAPRVTIADAARIGKTSVEVFYQKLEEIGFEIEKQASTRPEDTPSALVFPLFLQQLPENKIVELDVREDILTGNDPFLKIMDGIDAIPEEGALCLINTFEPTPLIAILKKKGLLHYTQTEADDYVKTWFYYNHFSPETYQKTASVAPQPNSFNPDYEQVKNRFAGQCQEVDVRRLEMPLPMVTILSELENLPENKALYVHHKRITHMLLPQLTERGFSFCIKEVADGDVKMLVYKTNG